MKHTDTEILYNTPHGETWYPLCRKPDCPHIQYRERRSNGYTYYTGYCYPHSRWYRPLLVPINRFVSWLEDLWEKVQ